MANIIKDLNHSDTHQIIRQFRTEPCLYDPTASYYRNQKKRKEAYQRITDKVNRKSSTKYSVADIMANIKKLRNEYRKYRSHRMSLFTNSYVLSEPQKWWMMMYGFIKDENKFSQNSLCSEFESDEETKSTYEKSVRCYVQAEQKFMAEKSLCYSSEESGTEDQESGAVDGDGGDTDTSSDVPASKRRKTSTETNLTSRAPKLRNEFDLEADIIISELHDERCLRDPRDKFYKNNKKREEAYQRIADKINDFDSELDFTAADVKANVEMLRGKYRNHRQLRIRRYALKKKVHCAAKWWRQLYYLLVDETRHDEPLCIHQPFTKAQIQKKYKKLVSDYSKYEKKCMDGKLSYDEDDDEYETDEEILNKTSCSSTVKKFCFTRLPK